MQHDTNIHVIYAYCIHTCNDNTYYILHTSHYTLRTIQYTHYTNRSTYTLYTIYKFCGYRYSHIAVHIHYTQYINIIDIDIQYITGHISQYIYNRL